MASRSAALPEARKISCVRSGSSPLDISAPMIVIALLLSSPDKAGRTTGPSCRGFDPPIPINRLTDANTGGKVRDHRTETGLAIFIFSLPFDDHKYPCAALATGSWHDDMNERTSFVVAALPCLSRLVLPSRNSRRTGTGPEGVAPQGKYDPDVQLSGCRTQSPCPSTMDCPHSTTVAHKCAGLLPAALLLTAP